MGNARFDHQDYANFTATTANKTTSQIYSSRHLKDDLNPRNIKVRESRDSDANPESTPIIVALDVTGSMGVLADKIAREGLGTLFTGIYDRKPVSDPHIMFMGIGDARHDAAPLQASQFEADTRIIEQLTNLYLEGGGGGNASESYDLAWYFAATKTDIDSMTKRGKRGYLFTIGDERAPYGLTREHIKQFIGDDVEADLTPQELLQMAQRKFDVFHVVIEEGNHARGDMHAVKETWRNMLGERVIPLSDYTKLAETIVSAIEVAEGIDADKSARGWGAGHSVIHRAVAHIPKAAPRVMLGGPSA